MSSIKLESNASGTGIFTIASPNSNTNRTLTLPDNTGTIVTTGSSTAITQSMIGTGVAGTGPAFSVYRDADQTGVGGVTFTKVQFNKEDFDTASCFDSSTNYRFTPNVAGYYQVNWIVYPTGASPSQITSGLYKNGSFYKYGTYISGSVGNVATVGSELVYMNGSTDYIEIFGYAAVTSGTVTFGAASGSQICRFSGSLARAA